MNQVWTWIIDGIAHLLSSLKGMLAGMVGKVLATFGLTIVSFSALLPQLKSFVLQFISGMPAEAVNFLSAIGVGQMMSMILSALAVRMAWKVFIVPKAAADAIGAGS